MIKKVTVKFDSCGECPVSRYSFCHLAEVNGYNGIPDNCPIDTSVMMYRFTDFGNRPAKEDE